MGNAGNVGQPFHGHQDGSVSNAFARYPYGHSLTTSSSNVELAPLPQTPVHHYDSNVHDSNMQDQLEPWRLPNLYQDSASNVQLAGSSGLVYPHNDHVWPNQPQRFDTFDSRTNQELNPSDVYRPEITWESQETLQPLSPPPQHVQQRHSDPGSFRFDQQGNQGYHHDVQHWVPPIPYQDSASDVQHAGSFEAAYPRYGLGRPNQPQRFDTFDSKTNQELNPSGVYRPEITWESQEIPKPLSLSEEDVKDLLQQSDGYGFPFGDNHNEEPLAAHAIQSGGRGPAQSSHGEQPRSSAPRSSGSTTPAAASTLGPHLYQMNGDLQDRKIELLREAQELLSGQNLEALKENEVKKLDIRKTAPVKSILGDERLFDWVKRVYQARQALFLMGREEGTIYRFEGSPPEFSRNERIKNMVHFKSDVRVKAYQNVVKDVFYDIKTPEAPFLVKGYKIIYKEPQKKGSGDHRIVALPDGTESKWRIAMGYMRMVEVGSWYNGYFSLDENLGEDAVRELGLNGAIRVRKDELTLMSPQGPARYQELVSWARRNKRTALARTPKLPRTHGLPDQGASMDAGEDDPMVM
ncbi:hypothetical protein ACQY0O_006064 [Thecaphora frezii]